MAGKDSSGENMEWILIAAVAIGVIAYMYNNQQGGGGA